MKNQDMDWALSMYITNINYTFLMTHIFGTELADGQQEKKVDHHLEDTVMTKLTYAPPCIL